MSAALIILGCFLWFTMLINGGVGTEIINISFFISGAFLVTSGLLNATVRNKKLAMYSATAAILFYMPFMWQGLVIYQDFISVVLGLFILLIPFFFILSIRRKLGETKEYTHLGDGET